MLMQEYKTCYGDCAGDRTIHKLSLLIAMFESSEMFEKIGQKLKTNLIIDIDRDVDYVEWSNRETWIETKSKINQYASSLTYESLNMDKSLFANSMADMLHRFPKPLLMTTIRINSMGLPIRKEISSRQPSTT